MPGGTEQLSGASPRDDPANPASPSECASAPPRGDAFMFVPSNINPNTNHGAIYAEKNEQPVQDLSRVATIDPEPAGRSVNRNFEENRAVRSMTQKGGKRAQSSHSPPRSDARPEDAAIGRDTGTRALPIRTSENHAARGSVGGEIVGNHTLTVNPRMMRILVLDASVSHPPVASCGCFGSGGVPTPSDDLGPPFCGHL